jgi:catechol 2,3-dioxygenase-like lactoylglutathione lyase family enzyme
MKPFMNLKHVVTALVAATTAVVAAPVAAHAADYHHVHITASSPSEAVRWYAEYLDCQPVADRRDAASCGGVELVFVVQPTMGTTQGTGVNHIGFSYADVTTKMAELEAVGVRGSGVRLQRFDDGSTLREAPGLFTHGFIFDPWGTRIELVEDQESLGFHHVHLSATDPEVTLAWYRDVLGGEPASLRGRLDGLLFGDVWVLAAAHPDGVPATTEGRAIDHVAFVVPDLDDAAGDMRRHNVAFLQEPSVPENARTSAKRALLVGPDNVRVAVVETGFAGVVTERAALATDASEPYDAPKTPWGTPDLQGVWTGNSAHGIPLERPLNAGEVEALTPEEAEARRERGTLGSIWGYEREWRDTTLGYVKTAPSTQIAMIIDPPSGRVPPMTARGEELAALARQTRSTYTESPAAGPEDLTPFVRCLTRGLPGMMMPSIYNNGLQIAQGPGFVTIQKEMIHETRVIPTSQRPSLGEGLDTWLGDPQGRWEGDTLVIETTNFNGRISYRGSSADMTLIERYTRIGPTMLEYQFTVDDPVVWTQPWTGRFNYDLDTDQYELVEYACHEGNYGMTNILSGARAQEAAEAATK